MNRKLYAAWNRHPARELLRQAANGNAPADDEYAAVHDDPEKAAMVKAAAAGLADKARGATGAQRARLRDHADQLSSAFVALHGGVELAPDLSPDDEAEIADAVESITADREIHRGVYR